MLLPTFHLLEDCLSKIFGLFAKAGCKINLMQNSAISFSVCVDNDPTITRFDGIKKEYRVLYNDDLVLYTIRHYNTFTLEQLTKDRELLLEQRSRNTAQVVMRAIETEK